MPQPLASFLDGSSRNRHFGDSGILSLSPDEIRRVIRDSNKQSFQGSQKYIVGENRAIHSDYEFIACPCGDECWCNRNACGGHYRIKEVAFGVFLKTYVTLWVPPKAREKVKEAVLEGAPFNGRQRNAIQPLQWLRGNWFTILHKVREYDKCGLCDSTVPIFANVSNLYESKMWSQLFYDSLVPFDTKSRIKIKRIGYPDPTKNFLAMSKELFRDLRRLSEKHELGVSGIRQLDSPWMDFPRLTKPIGGQPLSRVADKIFYSPDIGRPDTNKVR